jgi:type I restriction enzyme S subunit
MNVLANPKQELPTQWGSKKLKYVASMRSGEAITSEAIAESGDYPVFGGNGMRGYTSGYTHEGDFALIGRQGALCGNINYASGRFWASEHAVVVDTHGRSDVRWLGAVLSSMDLNQYSQSAAQPGLSVDVIANLEIPVPPLLQQQEIAHYLDRETARIDCLVVAKERWLEILDEKRLALIIHAVTRGLGSNVRRRDSGIPWLGQVPEHWKTLRLAALFRDRDERGEPDLPLLEVSINSGVVLREFSDERIESTAADFNTYKVARRGDVVFNKMRMWQGAVGVAKQDGLVSPDYTVATPIGELTDEYAGVLFRTSMFSAECARQSHGIVWDRMRLYWEGFRDIVVPVPPLKDQTAIVAHITAEAGRLDALRTAADSTIELLKERRAALVTAAVTGRIDLIGKRPAITL